MRPADTSLGGAARGFPATTWTLVAKLGASGSQEQRAGFEELCRTYWKPVYQYVRIAWSKSNEDAKDLAQAFFAWLAESDPLRTYAPARGGFRPYLKVLLKRFVGHEVEAMNRLKRGGGVAIVPLDAALPPAAPVSSPEEAFDREWLNEVVGAAVERVRARFEATGRAAPFAAFEEYDLRPQERQPSYEDLAARWKVKAGDVRNWLFSVREAVRAEVRAELARTTSDPAELEDEYRALFGA